MMVAEREPSQPEGPLSQRLNYLFAHIHPASGRFTNAHVAETISGGPDEYGGVRLTEQYLSMLRNGKRTNPHPDILRALAKFFGVPVGYLLGDLSDSQAARVEEEVGFLVAMRDQRVRSIALRAVGLPPEVQDSLTAIISQFRQQMNLPADPTGPTSPGPPTRPGSTVTGFPAGVPAPSDSRRGRESADRPDRTHPPGDTGQGSL